MVEMISPTNPQKAKMYTVKCFPTTTMIRGEPQNGLHDFHDPAVQNKGKGGLLLWETLWIQLTVISSSNGELAVLWEDGLEGQVQGQVAAGPKLYLKAATSLGGNSCPPSC